MRLFKLAITYISFSLCGGILFGQGASFNPNQYPSSQYTLDTLSYTFQQAEIRFILARSVDYSETPESIRAIWFQHIIDLDQKIEKNLGSIEIESGFYIPEIQPFDKYFIFVECGEFNGTVHIVDPKGTWTSVPGLYFGWSADKQYLVTMHGGEGIEEMAKINLTSKQVEIIFATLYDGQPWKGDYQYYEVQENDWIR